jgi:hypothetical protein
MKFDAANTSFIPRYPLVWWRSEQGMVAQEVHLSRRRHDLWARPEEDELLHEKKKRSNRLLTSAFIPIHLSTSHWQRS